MIASTKKPEPISRFGFKFYPAGAVQVILPFPFGKGRMTVAAEADFQSRRAISRNNQASYVHQLSVRGLHLNREHRRANSKAAGRELGGKHWFPSQPSTSGSQLKELFAQFRAEVASQSLANFRVRCIHFLVCQCATPVSICQSICERLFVRADLFCE